MNKSDVKSINAFLKIKSLGSKIESNTTKLNSLLQNGVNDYVVAKIGDSPIPLERPSKRKLNKPLIVLVIMSLIMTTIFWVLTPTSRNFKIVFSILSIISCITFLISLFFCINLNAKYQLEYENEFKAYSFRKFQINFYNAEKAKIIEDYRSLIKNLQYSLDMLGYEFEEASKLFKKNKKFLTTTSTYIIEQGLDVEDFYTYLQLWNDTELQNLINVEGNNSHHNSKELESFKNYSPKDLLNSYLKFKEEYLNHSNSLNNFDAPTEDNSTIISSKIDD